MASALIMRTTIVSCRANSSSYCSTPWSSSHRTSSCKPTAPSYTTATHQTQTCVCCAGAAILLTLWLLSVLAVMSAVASAHLWLDTGWWSVLVLPEVTQLAFPLEVAHVLYAFSSHVGCHIPAVRSTPIAIMGLQCTCCNPLPISQTHTTSSYKSTCHADPSHLCAA